MAYTNVLTITFSSNQYHPTAFSTLGNTSGAASSAGPARVGGVLSDLFAAWGSGAKIGQVDLQLGAGISGVAASQTITFTGAQALGSGDGNGKAFTFIAGSSGACTVTVAGITGITVTGSGTAATDATALAAAITASAAGLLVTATANSGDVRLVSKLYGNVGNSYTTVVTATGGGKLSASGATLASGTPTGSLGNAVIGGRTVSLGSAGSTDDVVATANAVAAAINADATAKTYVAAVGSVVSHNPVATLTALTSPSTHVLGNAIPLTASVGSAGAAALAGGVNASANAASNG